MAGAFICRREPPSAMSDRTTAAGRKIGWFAALSPRFLADPSTLFLIAANLLPLVGVLFWHWDLYSLLVLYWMETGIIGFFAIIRMAIAQGFFSIILVPFFVVHFGGFMVGHLFFLTVLFGGKRLDQPEQIPDILWSLMFEHGLWVAFVALFISHGVSFLRNVLRPFLEERRKEYRYVGMLAKAADEKKDGKDAMTAPYGRVIVMHVTIIFGAILTQVFQTKVAALVLLIALKIVIDVAAHVRKNYSAMQLSTQ